MNENIKKSIDEFLDEFRALPAVKKYVALKGVMAKDEEFLLLKKEHQNAQKELATSLNEKDYEEKKVAFLKIDERYKNHPYIKNSKEYEEEIHALLKEIELHLR